MKFDQSCQPELIVMCLALTLINFCTENVFSCQDTRKKSCTVGTSRCAKRKSNCAGTEPQCPHGTEEYLRGSCTCHLCLQLCSSPFETMFPNYRFFRWVKTTISDDIP